MAEDRTVALAQMKQAVKNLGSSADNYENEDLMRFLIARSMVPEKAAKMFVQWQSWRALMVPDSGSIPEAEVRDQLDDRKVFLGGLTKEGHPLLIAKGSRHYPPKDRFQFQKFVVYSLDKSVASAYKGGRETGNEKLMVIIDLDQISYRNLDTRALITSFQILQAYYPERLAKCYIVHMPRFFVSIWRMVSYFLDKATLEKVIIVNNEDEKNGFIKQVGEEILPEEYGGKAKLVAIQDSKFEADTE
ncbi:hypothetical protein Dimus_014582 [Dionaea muscipula]